MISTRAIRSITNLRSGKEIGQSADMRRPRVAGEPDASTRSFTLRRRPERTVRAHCEHLRIWSECTGRTRRSGGCVYTSNPTRTVRERYARRVKYCECEHGFRNQSCQFRLTNLSHACPLIQSTCANQSLDISWLHTRFPCYIVWRYGI